MGYLEDLKRQADEALARQSQDTGALERNALVTDSACQSAARYLASLARQLNVLAAALPRCLPLRHPPPLQPASLQ